MRPGGRRLVDARHGRAFGPSRVAQVRGTSLPLDCPKATAYRGQMQDTQTAATTADRDRQDEPPAVFEDGVPYTPDDEFLAAARVETMRWSDLLARLAE